MRSLRFQATDYIDRSPCRFEPVSPVPRIIMAGRKFLNPSLKVAVCLIGMFVMGYVLYPAIRSGSIEDSVTIFRGLVFLGFAYFLVHGIKQMLESREK